jgi:hypothetical protein
LSPLEESQYFLWSLYVHSMTAFLAAPTEMLQADSGPMEGYTGLTWTINLCKKPNHYSPV